MFKANDVIKSKILIIPSWYPTMNRPGLGTFFKEQALLLSSDYDVRIMYGEKAAEARLSKVANYFRCNAYIDGKNELLKPPEGRYFLYTQIPNRFKRKNLERMINAYVQQYEILTSQGWSPHVVHAQDTYPAGLVAQRIKEQYGIPYILTEHNYVLYQESDYVKSLMKTAVRSADKLLVVSSSQKRKFAMLDIRRDAIVVGNLIDDNRYFKQYPDPIGRSLLFVGRDALHKDITTFIQALELLDARDDVSNIDVNIVSYGLADNTALHDRLKSLTKLKITIYDSIDNTMMPEFISRHKIFVSTSIEETFGCSIVEAAMMGLEMVITDCLSIRDFCTEQDAHIVPIMNPVAVADAIVLVLHGDRRNSESLRERLVVSYGYDAFTNKMKTIVDNLINQP